MYGVQVAEQIFPKKAPMAFLISLIAGALLFVPHFVNATRRETAAHLYRDTAPFGRAGSCQLPVPQINAYTALNRWVNTKVPPNEHILFFPYDGAFYFLVNRENPVAFPVLAYAVRSDQQQNVIFQMEDSNTQWVVWDTQNQVFDNQPISEFLGGIQTYIVEHYKPIEMIGPFSLLKKI
jgi:hypothetical protein